MDDQPKWQHASNACQNAPVVFENAGILIAAVDTVIIQVNWKVVNMVAGIID